MVIMPKSATACTALVEKTLPLLHRPANSTREIAYGARQKICSSDVWRVALWARRQQPGAQEVDFSHEQLVGFLSELAGRGLPEGEAIELSDVCDGIIYSFSRI